MKQWLLEIRNNSAEVGRIALEGMESRTRRWRQRRDRDPFLRMSRVGSAVELVTYEKTECACLICSIFLFVHRSSVDPLDNEQLKIKFEPLYECIHIYSALDSLEELQRSYHSDRKVFHLLLMLLSELMFIQRLNPISFFHHPFPYHHFLPSHKRSSVSSLSRTTFLKQQGVSDRSGKLKSCGTVSFRG
jgi:hypothetical protein